MVCSCSRFLLEEISTNSCNLSQASPSLLGRPIPGLSHQTGQWNPWQLEDFCKVLGFLSFLFLTHLRAHPLSDSFTIKSFVASCKKTRCTINAFLPLMTVLYWYGVLTDAWFSKTNNGNGVTLSKHWETGRNVFTHLCERQCNCDLSVFIILLDNNFVSKE